MSEASTVVDASIFSLLLRGAAALHKRFLTESATRLYRPRFVFVGLIKH